MIYVVNEGDTVQAIAQKFGSSTERILYNNSLTNDSVLVPGQALLILVPNVTHTVREGDTLSSLAVQYNTSIKQLLANNPTKIDQETLFPGESIIINYLSGSDQRILAVNGYAYPFIDRTVLKNTLPYLTYLTIFTYGFTPEGDLIDIDDEELIELALSYQVAPLMLLSTLTEDGTFSNELASRIFSDREARENLFQQIIFTMNEKGYYGLDVDFEFVYPSDRENYVSFLAELKARLEEEGFPLITALAPKTSDEQRGLLYEAHDYGAIGAVADYVLLMTYEWGYTYGPPMAVSPLNKVKQVLDYGVSEIPKEKIFQGVPNYAYDWTLPYVRGESRAQTLGNEEAVQLAEENRATILFDEVAQTPTFFYTDEEGRAHVVWFEDVRSINAKLLLNESYPLYGFSYWNIMRPFRQNWLLLNEQTEIINLYE